MKISVAFIVYNGARYISTQLDSILAQTHKVDEIIVCDDASSDNTKEILEVYKNKNPDLFLIHYNTQNIGPTKNIENAIQACTGELILFADQDDYWEAHKVENIVKWFKENPTMNGLFTNGSLMNSKDELDNKYALWDIMSFPYKTVKSKTEINNNLKLYINTVENAVTGATLAIRNNLPFLKQPFPTIKHLVHDRWLAINLAETNSLGILEDKLIRYRIHSAQAIGGMTENIEKYIELNANLLEGTTNTNNSIVSFKDLSYILNKIETNLEIQNEISKIENKSFDNTNYIAILKNKHKIYLEYGFVKWPILSGLRKFKKLFIDWQLQD
jgi:glycosyltransferase involved in cell wall biosynthesis